MTCLNIGNRLNFLQQIQCIFCCKVAKGKQIHSIDSQVWQRVAMQGEGWVFTPNDFADLGSRTAVASALMRYAASGQIRQLSRGLYDWPRQHPLLG